MASQRRFSRSRVRRGIAIAALAVLGGRAVIRPPLSYACDLCAIYTATELRETRPGAWLGIAEQYSHFATLKLDGDEVDNPANQRLDSSITQILLGYNLNSTIGFQLSVPIISRSFRRIEDGSIQNGDVAGFGDLALLGIWRPYSWVGEESVFNFSLVGGLKLPSGSPHRLEEEVGEDHHHEMQADDDQDAGDGSGEEMANAVHGHDLALGSGSVDGIIGGQTYLSWRRAFVTAALQYRMRTEGSFDYRYANDLWWSGGPGFYILLGDDLAGRQYSLAIQAVVSGEHKGKDELDGETVHDTALTTVYLGPALSFTWGTSLGLEIAADLPVAQDTSGLQIVPEYRIRGGATWRF
jgi:hypothetical protein